MLKKKKPLIFLAVFVLVMGVVLAVILTSQKEENHSAVQTAPDQQLEKQLDKACEIFTLEKAKELLGPDAVISDQTNSPVDSFSSDIAASQCIYTDKKYDQATPAESHKQASLTVRSPRSDTGRQANQSVFEVGSLPAGAQKVAGYGDAAFWNAEFGQLNILKSGEWYVLDYGSLVPSSRSQGDTEKFAEILKNSL